MVSTGGQSREGLGSVLVTPSGKVVGSANVTESERRKGRGGTSRSKAREAQERARLKAEAEARAKAEIERRIAEEKARAEAEIRAVKERVKRGQILRASFNRFKEKQQQRFNQKKRLIEEGVLKSEARRLELREQRKGMSDDSRLDRFRRNVNLVGQTVASRVGQTFLGTLELVDFAKQGSKKVVRASIRNVKDLPSNQKKLVKQLAKNPDSVKYVSKKTAKKITNTIKNAPAGTVRVVKLGAKSVNKAYHFTKENPTEALAIVGTEVILLAGSGQALKVVGKVTKTAGNKIPFTTTPFKEGEVIIKKGGKKLLGKGEKKGLKLKVGSVKTASKTIPEQVKLAGKKLRVVTSAQSQKLVSLSKQKKLIRKPIPNEDKFTELTKRLLKKFDNKKITKAEVVQLQKRLAVETKRLNGFEQSLLERSTYFSPDETLRISRLGLQKDRDATLREIFTGKARFFGKDAKPQILIIEDADIEKIPRSLSKIRKKLEKGLPLTQNERIKLSNYQIKTSKKLKPVGNLTYRGGIEAEVTVTPNAYLKAVKFYRPVVINGQRVSIARVKVVVPPQRIRNLLSKLKKGTLKKVEKTRLNSALNKLVGRRINLDSLLSRSRVVRRVKKVAKKRAVKKAIRRRVVARKPSARVGRKALATRLTRKKKPLRKTTKTPTRKPTRSPPRKSPPRKSPPRTPPRKSPPRKSPPRTPSKSPPRRGPPRTPPRKSPPSRKKPTPLILPKGFTQKRLSKPVDSYYIKIRRGGKIVNLNARPLSLQDAKDYLAYSVDNKLVRSGWFEPIGRTNRVVGLPSNMKGYFSRNSKKLRPFKIRLGKRKLLRNGYIEKNKYILDTRGEKRSLSQLRKKKKVKRG